MRILPLLFLLSLFVVSCGGNRTEAMDNVEENAKKADDEAAAMAEKAAMAVKLVPMPATQDFPDAKITSWDYKDGKFTYGYTGYEFAAPTPDADQLMCANSDKGQHAHLIIDNEPYIAKYEPEFEQKIEDGAHTILTFLSRSYHESIKNGTAFRAWNVEVKNGAFTKKNPVTEPMLFYSRPKGKYTGKKATENVMLDFYPVNAELGEGGYQVKAVVNGKDEFMIDEWKPYYLQRLPMGENTVQLTLMKDGKAVEAPLNPVTREFVLEGAPTDS